MSTELGNLWAKLYGEYVQVGEINTQLADRAEQLEHEKFELASKNEDLLRQLAEIQDKMSKANERELENRRTILALNHATQSISHYTMEDLQWHIGVYEPVLNNLREEVMKRLKQREEEQRQEEQAGSPEPSKFRCRVALCDRDSNVALECGHMYCNECISEWMAHNQGDIVCPSCRVVSSKCIQLF
jgi:hypothetical protein